MFAQKPIFYKYTWNVSHLDIISIGGACKMGVNFLHLLLFI